MKTRVLNQAPADVNLLDALALMRLADDGCPLVPDCWAENGATEASPPSLAEGELS